MARQSNSVTSQYTFQNASYNYADPFSSQIYKINLQTENVCAQTRNTSFQRVSPLMLPLKKKIRLVHLICEYWMKERKKKEE